jgi:WS/DGAT/MGAT family acyltransferase
MSIILDASPDAKIEPVQPWKPRPPPSWGRLATDAMWHRVTQPFEALAAARDAVRAPQDAASRIKDAVEGLGAAFAPSFSSASATPLNVPCGPHRRFGTLAHRVRDYKQVKDALGGTLNDVVLATVAGALRQFFLERGITVAELEVRAMVPVSVRARGAGGALGNQITQMVAELPVGLGDPIERLKAVREIMGDLKESKQALGGRVLTAVAEWTVPNVLVQAIRMTVRARPYNLVVTNVPGPQIPLYFLGCPMRASYPMAPLTPGQALNVALFSYDGGLFWGLNADYDAIPDLARLVELVRESFVELQEAAGIEPSAHA